MRYGTTTISSITEKWVFSHAETLDTIVDQTSDTEDAVKSHHRKLNWDQGSRFEYRVWLCFDRFIFGGAPSLITPAIILFFGRCLSSIAVANAVATQSWYSFFMASVRATTIVTNTRTAATKRGGLDIRLLMKVGSFLLEPESEGATGLMVAPKATLQS